MTNDITIRPAEGTWVIRAGGAVLGESSKALELTEEGYPFVIYFPREDIGMAFLDRSDTTTTCPKKGVANYYSIMSKSQTYIDAVWTYENPKDEVAEIKGYLAFHVQDGIAVEQL
ncbi:Uncharacterized conserved protein, DUF427 family [Roseivivax halotolerans]|uniref:Uncharacterized conserved protein, DUF427 family n=1 Tax=Roseivivax halotolerans TaxID=93684 RepID=A0A1I5XNZ5_9RHOB|nr:DUF427 domain-containing protein [Roseivivax halotolerans]SFQ33668.1 Uncharacterized conserved protein, DUF427 family [Roseivivax halotolerans]